MSDFVFLESPQIDRMRRVATRLYREDRMSGDEMRDLAQTITSVVDQAVDYDAPPPSSATADAPKGVSPVASCEGRPVGVELSWAIPACTHFSKATASPASTPEPDDPGGLSCASVVQSTSGAMTVKLHASRGDASRAIFADARVGSMAGYVAPVARRRGASESAFVDYVVVCVAVDSDLQHALARTSDFRGEIRGSDLAYALAREVSAMATGLVDDVHGAEERHASNDSIAVRAFDDPPTGKRDVLCENYHSADGRRRAEQAALAWLRRNAGAGARQVEFASGHGAIRGEASREAAVDQLIRYAANPRARHLRLRWSSTLDADRSCDRVSPCDRVRVLHLVEGELAPFVPGFVPGVVPGLDGFPVRNTLRELTGTQVEATDARVGDGELARRVHQEPSQIHERLVRDLLQKVDEVRARLPHPWLDAPGGGTLASAIGDALRVALRAVEGPDVRHYYPGAAPASSSGGEFCSRDALQWLVSSPGSPLIALERAAVRALVAAADEAAGVTRACDDPGSGETELDPLELRAGRLALLHEQCDESMTPGAWSVWTSNSFRRITAEDGRDGGVLRGVHRHDGQVDLDGENRDRDLAGICTLRNATAEVAVVMRSLVQRQAGIDRCKTWRRDDPPVGVRCLVTTHSTTGALCVQMGSMSSDHSHGRAVWFSDGARLLDVVAWMPAPEPAGEPGDCVT